MNRKMTDAARLVPYRQMLERFYRHRKWHDETSERTYTEAALVRLIRMDMDGAPVACVALAGVIGAVATERAHTQLLTQEEMDPSRLAEALRDAAHEAACWARQETRPRVWIFFRKPVDSVDVWERHLIQLVEEYFPNYAPKY